jgi:pyruvate/2-oxoglutarate dehydrogenase complex dihydrolipoamide acyltransferase (E2) component
MAIEVTVPDIGDFDQIPVVTVLVSVGDTVALEDPIVELESDKATMEVPSSSAGIVKEIKVSEGDKVSMGSLILILEGECPERGTCCRGTCAREKGSAPDGHTSTLCDGCDGRWFWQSPRQPICACLRAQP